jgi:hypothetical protein
MTSVTQIGSAAADREVRAFAGDRVNLRDRAEPLERTRILNRHDHRPLGAVTAHELRRRANVDDTAVVENRHAIAEPPCG